MNIDEKHKKIIEVVKNKLTCSAHNLDHVFRVYNCYVSNYLILKKSNYFSLKLV
ncbi:metal dependent phosphohydrolase, partial [Clostridium pasteurianum DSM 525 = ATCC 6013]